MSRMILDALIEGRIGERDFRQGFHLPNSDYLPVTERLLRALVAPLPRRN